MRTNHLTPSLALLLLASCATAGGGRSTSASSPAAMHQADERIPPLAAFKPGPERILYNQALEHERRGWQLESAGDAAAAREPLAAAAQGYLDFVKRFRGTGWDVSLRYHAADLLRRAGRFDEAATLAEQLAADRAASAKTKAMALLQAVNAQVGAGRIEALKIAPAGERPAGAAEPRPLPEPWKRFVEATDAFLASPEATRPEPPDRTLSAGLLTLVAARAAFATNDMEGARRRLETVLERWSGDHRVFEGAAPLYVQTFLAKGDHQGAQSAVERVRETARAQADKATAQDAKAAYERVANETERVASGVRYERAKALLEAGQAAEAAEAFEALAGESGGDHAAALVAAAIAWDKAGKADRAAELRRKVMEEHADSRVAPNATLQLAAYLSRKGDHAESARVYGLHAERWKEDPNHCAALQNGAIEMDLVKRPAEAAERYRAFGTEARCAQGSPDVAALALHRAGQLFLQAKKRAEARDAFQAATEVQNVSTPDAKRRVAEARREVKRLGGQAAARRAPR